jgi:phospholipid/cholesterol/gamma-HCH transport system permease protein
MGRSMTASDPVPPGARIELTGRITAYTVAPIWRAALETLAGNPASPVVVDAAHLEYADVVGIAFLFDLLRRERPAGAQVEIRNLPENLAALVHAYEPGKFAQPLRWRRHPGALQQIGRATLQQLAYLKEVATFVRECATELWQALTGRGVRPAWNDVMDITEEAGTNGVPVVLLIGFLMGVIIAFEAGLVARQFGAVIFVVSGVAFAVLRELGPLMTAIIFAGRTGAAYAAQLGIQKVNEEVNAITTFGLSPIQFLVLPRVIGALLVAPLLTVLADFAGLFGAMLVLARFGISFQQFYNQMLRAVTPWDVLLGVIKAIVFGLTVAIVGCHRGLATGAGASSVGLATTRAVVSSIVLIIVIDGIFAVFTI